MSDHSGGRLARTRAVRSGIATETQHGAVVPPIHLSTNFTFDGFGGKRPYDYSRSGNPTRDLLGGALAELEGGAGGVVTPSGMAAVTLAIQLLRPGDRLVAPHDAYGGTYRLFTSLAEKGHFDLSFVDLTASDVERSIDALGPRMIWIETPSNPLLRITDIEAVSELGRGSGAIIVVDNTFLSPVWQRPLELGADIVMHSTTKYLNGHSDVVGGAVVAKDAALHEELAWWANNLGITGAPFDAWLALRGVRTLHARTPLHEENTRAIVDALSGHPAVDRVLWPGLVDHPGHDIAKRQQHGFGAMVSFELAGGIPAVRALLDGLDLFTFAESLGGVESLIAHPPTMTHASMDEDARREAGIGDSLLRISVGIEAEEDLVADLRAGLDRAARVAQAAR